MKVKQKHSPTFVISLTEEEAIKLHAFLALGFIDETQTEHWMELNALSIAIADELEELLEDKVVAS